ncbi:MAG: FAD-dependent monooxygenase [Chitinophagales bacterium]|nr:FAD-dependent monooxygenase [Chitinophagales bacterium]
MPEKLFSKVKEIVIIGAGLVGSLLSIYLKKKGYHVSVYEKRPDMRASGIMGGRSINLAISDRGWKALAGVGLENEIRKLAIPMHGRMVHTADGQINYQPYGNPGQFINSVSRGQLNIELITAAENNGIQFFFNQCLVETNLSGTHATMEDELTKERYELKPDLIIGADGSFSLLRYTIMKTDKFNYSQEYEEHSYKELSIPAGEDNNWRMEKNALHIWPRKSFMLIALPNLDGSFTCTLFHYTKGENSIHAIQNENDLDHFFEQYFPDAKNMMPTLHDDFFSNPTGSLVTVKCFPWVNGNSFLIGDAAHAIIPFYGQGMNCGFEDCTVLNELIGEHEHDWNKILTGYQAARKPNSDAIADLAKYNFIEMRDLVADPAFQLKKKIAARISELYPDRFTPVYTMVSFSHMPYAEALQEYKRQNAVLDEILKMPQIEEKWYTEYLNEIAALLIKK